MPEEAPTAKVQLEHRLFAVLNTDYKVFPQVLAAHLRQSVATYAQA